MSDPTDREKRIRERNERARASAIGLQFGISIAVGALGGNWLDKRYDTGPWLLLLGFILGSTAAFRDLYKFAKSQSTDASPKD
ncbi:MAG: F0F1-type ATP synthase assembly protein I [Bradymonadia bacterium]|jgi:F0F1-type ATP synthase assembly protein I